MGPDLRQDDENLARDRGFNTSNRADQTQLRVLAAYSARGLLRSFCPHQTEGAGNAGCPMHPQPCVRYGGSEYAHRYSQRRHRKHPAFPTQWFYGFLRALPGDHRFVDPVIRATRWRLANLTPASGRQNHTASPSATASARLTLRRVHRIPPNVHDDREAPLLERRDGASKS
jgi:hypothetical protein